MREGASPYASGDLDAFMDRTHSPTAAARTRRVYPGLRVVGDHSCVGFL